jgi:DNA-directed RNA polymerase subunit alpha
MTIGNSLRRVLLSSVQGAAVVSVSIDGVNHEYDTIEGVREDVVQIILNLKSLRFLVNTDEEITLHLTAKGSKQVTAADII